MWSRQPGPPRRPPGLLSQTVTVNAFVDGAISITPATVTVTGTSANAPCPGSA